MVALDLLLAAHRAYLLGWDVGRSASPDLVTYRSDLPHAPLNGVLRVTGHAVPDALAEARHRLDGVPRIWWVGPDSDAETAEALLTLGAVQVAQMPIMAALIDQVATTPVPAGLHLAEATDLPEFVAAYARVSGIAPDSVPAVVDREQAFAADGTVIRLAGRLDDGRIVGTATAWLSHGLLTLYFVGTQPEHRRRGIGSALTRAALDLARHRGVRTVALTASAAGEPLYHGLGFRTVASFRLLSF
ncbi:GNAT family N-acetyltransferase [Plantactinospora sp. CA-290183]|uniref:GNAT family N-acetyltransferase n=1 Tax=Plantactinospora sp. CA-290183 TaxID=3240006 RepID=UPI003D90A026